MSVWHRGRVVLASFLLFAAVTSAAAAQATAEPEVDRPVAVQQPPAGEAATPDMQLASAPRYSPREVEGDGSVAATRDAAAKTWPFDPPSVAVLAASPRKVFAHWHIFPISLDNQPAENDYWSRNFIRADGEGGKFAAGGGMTRERPLPRPVVSDSDWRTRDMETEIRRAAAIGIDGFIFNIVGPPPNVHYDKLLAMLDAAQHVDPNFVVMLMIDAVTNKDRTPQQVAPAILQVANHPSVYHTDDGRLVLSTFSAEKLPVDWWQQLFAILKASGVKVYFVPVFQGWQQAMSQYAAISEGVSDWGRRTPAGAEKFLPAAAAVHQQGKIWMAPVAPQDSRPKSRAFWEPEGSGLFRESWRVAREGGADWVQVITWNDYAEGSEIAPSTGIQYAYYDLTAYYGTWFKTGKQPPITRDVLYYFHRIMPAATQAQSTQQQGSFQARDGEPPADIIELLAFLTEPGTLEIEIGGKTYKQEAKAGITSFTVPLAPGRPRFRLLRGGTVVIDFASAFEIRSKVEFQDFLYRAGSSSRPPVDMLADPPVIQ